MKQYLLALVVFLILSGCSALEVQTNYDKDFDFKSLSTFTVVYTNKEDTNDFTRTNISKNLTKYFQTKGYSLAKEGDSDFNIRFYLNVNVSRKEVQTDSVTTSTGIDPMLYCKPPSNQPMMTECILPYHLLPLLQQNSKTTVTTRTYDYEEGQLVVELIDSKAKSVVWQGIAVNGLEELSKNVESVIENLLKDFPFK